MRQASAGQIQQSCQAAHWWQINRCFSLDGAMPPHNACADWRVARLRLPSSSSCLCVCACSCVRARACVRVRACVCVSAPRLLSIIGPVVRGLQLVRRQHLARLLEWARVERFLHAPPFGKIALSHDRHVTRHTRCRTGVRIDRPTASRIAPCRQDAVKPRQWSRLTTQHCIASVTTAPSVQGQRAHTHEARSAHTRQGARTRGNQQAHALSVPVPVIGFLGLGDRGREGGGGWSAPTFMLRASADHRADSRVKTGAVRS